MPSSHKFIVYEPQIEMKVVLAQLNYRIGDIPYNVEKILNAIEKAKQEQADLVVFSELAICGYPPRDLLTYSDFITQVEEAIQYLLPHCVDIACILGAPTRCSTGKGLHNSALYIYQGEIQNVVHKALLPDYDVFDESRFFEPQTQFRCIEHQGTKIALTICEDLWDKHSDLYNYSPMEELAKEKPDFMINIAASPFDFQHAETRLNVLKRNVRQYNIPLLYVNQVGAQTELIFDGGSVVFNKSSQIVNKIQYFEESVFLVDTAKLTPLSEQAYSTITIAKIHDALVLGIREYFQKLGFKKATLGLSGGIDSAVVCVLACEALGKENVNAILLPSKFSTEHSVQDALDLTTCLGCHHLTLPIHSTTQALEDTLAPYFNGLPFNIAEENLQARSRAVLLMALSNKFGWVLLNTSNKSEAAVGYGTLYGDMCGALSVLGDVYKTQVYELAQYINRNHIIIPENTITKPPSAELRLDQKDSDSLPPYDFLDAILMEHIEKKQGERSLIAKGYDATLVKRILLLVKNAEHKRFQTAPTLRVSSKAFGFSRKMPIVSRYNF